MDTILKAGADHVAVERIRLNMKALGFPIDSLSDEEVSSGVTRINQITHNSGYTCAEATRVMTELAASGIDFRSIAWPTMRKR